MKLIRGVLKYQVEGKERTPQGSLPCLLPSFFTNRHAPQLQIRVWYPQEHSRKDGGGVQVVP